MNDSSAVPLDPREIRAMFEQASHASSEDRYVLRLYVTGMTVRSSRAIRNLQAICDEYLAGRYDLELIDVYRQPVLTRNEQIVGTPTLIKKLPLPARRIIGDLSNRDVVLYALDLVRAPHRAE